jgi:hypothetical protein
MISHKKALIKILIIEEEEESLGSGFKHLADCRPLLFAAD